MNFSKRKASSNKYPLLLLKNRPAQLGRFFYLWDWLESNQRPNDYESSALTTELQSHIYFKLIVGARGFEPLNLSHVKGML